MSSKSSTEAAVAYFVANVAQQNGQALGDMLRIEKNDKMDVWQSVASVKNVVSIGEACL